jgi:pyrroline-5-carboxylate reductase
VTTPQIAFIGAGNMAGSIIGGLLASGHPAAAIAAADPHPASLEKLASAAPVAIYEDNVAAAAGADVIVLAVKPQVMAAALASIHDTVIPGKTLILSIAAGLTIESIQARLPAGTAVVRCMPNTPALLGSGASALFASPEVTTDQHDQAEAILSAVGICCWVESEAALDAVTALSGSGPAYFFRFMESMIAAGCAQGLDLETARSLTLQTAMGAARMATESGVELAELRRRVTSPGGTTERALQSFEQDQLPEVVERAMRAAARRATEMASEFG